MSKYIETWYNYSVMADNRDGGIYSADFQTLADARMALDTLRKPWHRAIIWRDYEGRLPDDRGIELIRAERVHEVNQ